MDPKPILTSRTFWANVIGMAVLILSLVGVNVIGVEDQEALIAAALAVVNIVLRLLTSQPVTLR